MRPALLRCLLLEKGLLTCAHTTGCATVNVSLDGERTPVVIEPQGAMTTDQTRTIKINPATNKNVNPVGLCKIQ